MSVLSHRSAFRRDVHNRFGEGLRRFLWQIVPDAALMAPPTPTSGIALAAQWQTLPISIGSSDAGWMLSV